VRNGASDGVWYWCQRGENIYERVREVREPMKKRKGAERTSDPAGERRERREVVRRDGCKGTCKTKTIERMRE
jgi:hypothetical protein